MGCKQIFCLLPLPIAKMAASMEVGKLAFPTEKINIIMKYLMFVSVSPLSNNDPVDIWITAYPKELTYCNIVKKTLLCNESVPM